MKKLAVTLVFVALSTSVACGDDDGEVTIKPDGWERVSAARFNLSGDRLAMIGQNGFGADSQYALITTDDEGGDVKTITENGLDYLSTVDWSSDGQTLVYSGDGGIFRIPADGSAGPQLMIDGFAVNRLDLSPDDTKVVYSNNGSSSIEIADISGFDSQPVAAMYTGLIGQAPRFSPNGTELVYISGTDYTFVDVETFMIETAGPGGADYLSNAAWIDNNSLIYLAEDEIRSWTRGSSAETIREAFAGMDLDYNVATGRFIYGVNGQNALTIADY